jgi:hypothetical protein
MFMPDQESEHGGFADGAMWGKRFDFNCLALTVYALEITLPEYFKMWEEGTRPRVDDDQLPPDSVAAQEILPHRPEDGEFKNLESQAEMEYVY